MSNCLVTKFDREVSIDNPIKLGLLSFKKLNVQPTFNANYYVRIWVSAASKATTENSNFCDSSGASIGNSVNIPVRGYDYMLYLSLSTGDFDIEKYNITKLGTSFAYNQVLFLPETMQYMTALKELEVALLGKLSDLKRLDNLESIIIKDNSPIYGDISKFAEFTKLKTIRWSNIPSNMYAKGDIASLGNLVELTTFKINTGKVQISGRIEDFVAAQRTNGRTTCDSITWNTFGSSVTFNGAAISGSSDKTLSWTASTITFNGTTIDA